MAIKDWRLGMRGFDLWKGLIVVRSISFILDLSFISFLIQVWFPYPFLTST